MTASASSEGRPRIRMEPEARRDQIIACARRVFGEKPYGAVSLADIAREAGVARGLVNHYFGGKRELYLEVLREMIAVPDSVLERLPKGTLQERVSGVVDRFLSVVDRNRGMWLATVDALSHGHDPDVDSVMREAEEVTVDQTLRALGIDPGAEADEPLRGMCRAFGAMTRSATNEWLNRGTLSREQTFALLERTLLLIITEFGPERREE
ncbi:TetR/AcrR family transcriptional regulator [Streptomyces sp. NPDC058614]|uniref:TetR/AcrR family transcriptional regulator n=1 Tax=Streptomyces sp. NPDC058614 TaxID=3346557 RepID=UPI003654DABD